MADNVTVDNGGLTDYNVASDDDGTAQHQYVKVEFGPDNTQTRVTATTGLPIKPVEESSGIGVGAAADAEASGNGSLIAILKRVRTLLAGGLPAALVGGRLDVNLGAAPATVTVDSELTTADLDTGAGTDTRAVVGIVKAKSGGAVNISDTDPMPVSDAGGTLSVDDGAGSLTVDGTVTANAGTGPFPVSDNGGSLTVDAPAASPVGTRLSDGTSYLTTTGGRLSVDASAVAVPITDNSGSLTVDNAGTFAVQDSQVVTDNAAFTDGATKVQPVGYVFDEVAGTALTENDAAAARIDSKRAQIGVLEDATTRGQRAAVSAAGRVSVDASGVAVPVTDNGGSLTVDGTVGISGTADVSDRAARETGRVRIWDGTDEATVLPVRTAPATNEKTIPVSNIPNRLATFNAAIATQTPAITIGVKELLALWHDSTKTKDVYIVEIWVSGLVTTASTTGGRTTVRISTITTAPTGGTALTPVDTAGGTPDMTNTMQVKTGGGTIGTTFMRKVVWHATQAIGSSFTQSIFQASNPGNGLIFPGGTNAGISIDIEREVAHTALVDVWTVGARWIEV